MERSVNFPLPGEGTNTIEVYGNYIFLYNFHLAIMLEMFCHLN